jgi:hypothetical protein
MITGLLIIGAISTATTVLVITAIMTTASKPDITEQH